MQSNFAKAVIVAGVALASLGLAGCGEDKGAVLAQCRLDYGQGFTETTTCMRAQGYEYDTARCTPDIRHGNLACYRAVDITGQIGEFTRGQ